MAKENKILRGAREALAFTKGETEGTRVTTVELPEDIDVKEIRQKMELSQEEFAIKFGFAIGTLRHWEQKRRRPDGAARVLLTVIVKEPEAVERALTAA